MQGLRFRSPLVRSRVSRGQISYRLLTPRAVSDEADGPIAGADDAFISRMQPRAEPAVIFEMASAGAFQPVRIIEFPDSDHLHPSISELRGARILVLDNQGNIHSIYREAQRGQLQPTRSYWDVQAAFPSLLPQAALERDPIAILGLGAGTIARMISYLYPSVKMEGWELDPAIVMGARLWMGMTEIEEKGSLIVHTGDAFEASRSGGFPGIIVDLFSDGVVLPRLTQPEAWHTIKAMLGDGGRIMVNLGQSMSPRADVIEAKMTRDAVMSMISVFGSNEVSLLNIRNMDAGEGEGAGEIEVGTTNCLALTGPIEGVNESWQSISNELGHLKKYKWISAHQSVHS